MILQRCNDILLAAMTRRKTNEEKGGLTFTQRLLQQVVLGLQFNNEVAAIQVLLEFLDREKEAAMKRRAELIQRNTGPVKQLSVTQMSMTSLCSASNLISVFRVRQLHF